MSNVSRSLTISTYPTGICHIIGWLVLLKIDYVLSVLSKYFGKHLIMRKEFTFQGIRCIN